MPDNSELLFILVVLLFGGSFIVGGSYVAYDAYNAHVETQNEIGNSTQTTGTILENNIDEYTTRSDTDQSTTDTDYRFSVRYEYRVGAITYTSESIQPANDVILLDTRASANDYENKYSVGDEVTVNYQSNNPDESYLEETGGNLIVPILITSALILVGLYITRVGILALIDIIKNPDESG